MKCGDSSCLQRSLTKECAERRLCVCVHCSKCNFLMQKCGETEGSRGEVRVTVSVFGILNQSLSDLSVYSALGEHIQPLVNPVLAGTPYGGWEKGGGLQVIPPLHSASPFPCRSGPTVIMSPAAGSQSIHLWFPIYWLALPAPSISHLTLAGPPSTLSMFLLLVVAIWSNLQSLV